MNRKAKNWIQTKNIIAYVLPLLLFCTAAYSNSLKQHYELTFKDWLEEEDYQDDAVKKAFQGQPTLNNKQLIK